MSTTHLIDATLRRIRAPTLETLQAFIGTEGKIGGSAISSVFYGTSTVRTTRPAG